MRKTLRLLMLLCAVLPITASAQLNETFSNLTLTSVTIGTGTGNIGGLPTGWSQLNVDNLTPDASLSYMGTNAWISRQIATSATTFDTVAQSISWYAPAGTSNDYLISPLMMVANANTYLTWTGYAPDASYPDGYTVKISTTGTAAADFTTTLTTIAAENSNGFALHAASLAAYAGQSIYVAFINNSNDKYILFLDDINTTSITNLDAQMVNLNINRFAPISTNVSIAGSIYNNGSTINSLSIAWTDGGAPNTATLSGLNITPYSTYNFTHTTPFNQSISNEFAITATITAVNVNGVESDITNNVATATLSTVNNPPTKNVLIEEGTGTWCGWCPRGAVAMEHMDQTHTDGTFIGIAVHNNDPMTLTNYDAGAAFSGFPGCNVDRNLLGGSVSSNLFDSYYTAFSALTAPVAPSATYSYNAATKTITINASAAFKTKISDALNLLCVITEDGVHSTDAAYNQTNYYSSAANNIALNGAGHNWQTEANPVPAASMTYDHVGRALLSAGNYAGDNGSVPGPVVDGYTATKTYTYAIPATQDPTKLNIVIMVLDQTSGVVYNANKVAFDPSVGITKVAAEEINFTVVPNITNGNQVALYFESTGGSASYQVYNFAGQVAVAENIGQVTGKQTINLNTANLTAGAYFVALTINGVTHVQNLTIAK